MNEKLKQKLFSNEAIVVYLIVLLSAVIGFANPTFLSPATGINLLRTMLVTLIFALCEMIVIVSGGIDVSFPAVSCLTMIATIRFLLETGIDSIPLTYALGVLIGAGFGALNAFLITILRIPPLIATLAVSSITSGATLAFLGTKIYTDLPEKIDTMHKISLFTYTNEAGNEYAMTALILVPVFLCALIYFLLRHTMLGRGMYAIGGDVQAAHIVGFNVTKTRFFVYILSGAIAGIGAITYMILMRVADPKVLMGEEMMVIAAVVIGGTRITGGHGTVAGTILGVALLSLVKNNLIILGVPTHFQTFVVGMIIVFGTSITSIRAKRIAERAKI